MSQELRPKLLPCCTRVHLGIEHSYTANSLGLLLLMNKEARRNQEMIVRFKNGLRRLVFSTLWIFLVVCSFISILNCLMTGIKFSDK